MSMIGRSKRQVKPSRKTRREPSPFGAGILPYSQDFEAWEASMLEDAMSVEEYEAQEDAYNEMLDLRAEEDACLERYTRLCLPL